MSDDAVRPDSRLAASSSPFLRHGATQPVDWWPWGAPAFAAALAADRPVLLDIGAVWCHWCHVMDAESYGDAETAALINERFIPIKVDRDERPDVDARYQRAVQVLAGQGGWPLTAFLTPHGDVFYGGTYFPPRDAHGRPSFRRVLLEISRIWSEDRTRVTESTAAVRSTVERYADIEVEAGTPRAGLLSDALDSLEKSFDGQHGGFSQAPKFPNPGALDLLLDDWLDAGADRSLRMFVDTITAMGRGGLFDQIGGGFHRYSTDARWIIPHFEKMAGDNGPLLATYARAASALGDTFFAEIAGRVIEHYADIAPDLVTQGGFPASQDADHGFDNDGDYWTWTDAELRAALGDGPAYSAVVRRFGLEDDGGAMHLDPSRHVLFAAAEIDEVAAALGLDVDETKRIFDDAVVRMKAVRDARPAPFIDRSLFAGTVSLVAAGHLAGARFLGRTDARERALRALDRLWREGWQEGHGLLHRIGDPGSVQLLEDQALAAVAFLDAFELTQDEEWLDRARALAAIMERRFLDPESGAFRDRSGGADAPVPVLDRPYMPIADAPTPSGNGSAACAFVRLAAITGEEPYRRLADGVLRAFAGSAARLSASAATWLSALSWATRPVTTVLVVEKNGESLLLDAALSTYRPRMVVRALEPGSEPGPGTPPELVAMLSGDAPRAYVCSGRTCAAPVSDADDLRRLLREFRG